MFTLKQPQYRPEEAAELRTWLYEDFQSRYRKYLKSPWWLICKDRIWRLARNRCELCPSKNRKFLQVHHRSYSRLGEEQDTDLVLLCKACHKKLHATASKVDDVAMARISLYRTKHYAPQRLSGVSKEQLKQIGFQRSSGACENGCGAALHKGSKLVFVESTSEDFLDDFLYVCVDCSLEYDPPNSIKDAETRLLRSLRKVSRKKGKGKRKQVAAIVDAIRKLNPGFVYQQQLPSSTGPLKRHLRDDKVWTTYKHKTAAQLQAAPAKKMVIVYPDDHPEMYYDPTAIKISASTE